MLAYRYKDRYSFATHFPPKIKLRILWGDDIGNQSPDLVHFSEDTRARNSLGTEGDDVRQIRHVCVPWN